MHSSDHVRSYYDTNSRRFATWGPGKTSRSIHREVWGQGVGSAREATYHVDTLIGDIVEDELRNNTSLHILDVGCGLAGTLSNLALRFPSLSQMTGITISPVQVHLSRDAIRKEGLDRRITIHEADFHEIPQLLPVNVAYAIEAFVHARNADVFFKQVGQVGDTGAKLVLIDDFLTGIPVSDNERGTYERLVSDFSTGWLAPNVITIQEAAATAQKHGFILDSEMDLTQQLRIGRRRDRFIDLLYQVAGRLLIKRPYMRGLMGGAALQRAITKGWIKYSMLVFKKNPHASVHS